MNQAPTPTPIRRPPQRTKRPAPRRPMGENRPPEPPKSNISTALMITLTVTVILLILSIIVLCVALAVGGTDTPSTPSDDSSSGGNQQEQTQGDKPSANAGSKNKLYPTNPSRSTYQIPNASSYQTIDGISSGYAVLVELDSFSAVAGVNADAQICPASMTKIMTLLIACENVTSLSEQITISTESVTYQANHGASGLAWVGGEKVSVRDLLYAIYYRSDTVACLEMSKYIAGSEAAFVEMMNAKVKSMKLNGTKFSNSTGLYFEGDVYYSTCRDMAAIMAYALENTLAKEIITSTGAYYFSSPDAPVELIKPTWATDRFGGNATLDTVTIRGAKTGWENIPGACLVSYAEGNNGKQYVQVIVGGNGLAATKSTEDVKYIYKNYAK